jgi:hypothetical protein
MATSRSFGASSLIGFGIEQDVARRDVLEPATMRKVDDFPQPEGPRIDKN